MRVAVWAAALSAAFGLVPATMAQPRAPLPPWEDPMGPPVAMDVWLKRLVGRFRFEGLVQVFSLSPSCEQGGCEPVEGIGDCIAVGPGPGVQCIFNVRWHEVSIPFSTGMPSFPPGSVAYLSPAMALFGMEPGVPSLQYLLVNHKGLPEGGPGVNHGYRARFTTRCVNEVLGCRRRITYEAQEDARLLYMTIEIDNEISGERIASIVMSLRRVVPEASPGRRR